MKKLNEMLLELCSVERCLQSCVSHLLGTTNMPLDLFIAKVVKPFSVCVNCLNGCCLASKWEAWYGLQRPEPHFLHSLVTLQCSHYTWSDQYVSCHLSLL